VATDKITAPDRVTITVSYYAHEKPAISLPDNLKAQLQVEFIDLMEQDFLVRERRNVGVYRTYKDEQAGEVQDWATEWFSTERWTNWKMI
jgi:hypothetical protein